MTKLELFDIMRQVVMTVTNVPACILYNPNAPSPSGAYASINPKMNTVQRGQANQSTTASDTTVTQTISRQLIAECSINFYRVGAMDYARLLRECHKRPDVGELLMRAGVGWNRAGPINNLSALQSGGKEERAQISIFLMHTTEQTATANTITQVPVTIEDTRGEQLAEVNVND